MHLRLEGEIFHERGTFMYMFFVLFLFWKIYTLNSSKKYFCPILMGYAGRLLTSRSMTVLSIGFILTNLEQ